MTMVNKKNIAILGAKGVGKTTFINEWTKNPCITDNVNIFEQIDDELSNLIGINLDKIIVLYDVSSIETLKQADIIFGKLFNKNKLESCSCLLIANKCDLYVGMSGFSDGLRYSVNKQRQYVYPFLRDSGLCMHSSVTHKRYSINNTILELDIYQRFTIYDILNQDYSDKVKAREIDDLYLEPFMQIIENIDNFVSDNSLKLIYEIKRLYTENKNLKSELDNKNKEFNDIKTNIKNILM